MSYGWAILIIAVVLGVLFQLGVFSGSALAPKAQPGSCQVQRLLGQVSLEGLCQGQLPQFVARFNETATLRLTYVSVPHVTVTTPITIAMWIFPTDPTNSGGGEQDLITDRGSGSGTEYALRYDGGSTIEYYYWDGGAFREYSVVSSSLAADAWAFVAATNNGVAATFYIDGAQIGAPESTTGSPSTSGVCATTQISGICGAGYFNGYISNVQMYNATISANEVKALYNEGIGGAPIRLQNLVGWWPLNGNGDDYSGNNNNGQIHGPVVFNSTWNSGYTPP